MQVHQALFRHSNCSSACVYMLVYAGDILTFGPITSEKPHEIDRSVDHLKGLYELRLENDVEVFIGVKLVWNVSSHDRVNSPKASQSMCTESVLRRFGMHNGKPADEQMAELFSLDILLNPTNRWLRSPGIKKRLCHFCIWHVARDSIYWLPF